MFLPRYQFLNNFINIEGSETKTPGDWMSDNPYIGKIKGGYIQNEIIENGGNFWFDNYIGCNNHFLNIYRWFIILNDDWMIYLLWFGNYNEKDDIKKIKSILIKDRKKNIVIHSGILGAESLCSFPLDQMNHMFAEYKMTYISNKSLGDEKYDEYEVFFESNKIKINIKSIKDKSHKIINFDYYKNEDAYNLFSNMNTWDKEYYSKISKIKYVEYVNIVNVNIEYNNEIIQFTDRQVVDGYYEK